MKNLTFFIFILGTILTFLVYQYNQKTAVQLSLQEALGRNTEDAQSVPDVMGDR